MRENAEGTRQARRGWLLPESDPGCRGEGWRGVPGERFGQAAGEFLSQSHYQRTPVSPRSGSTWVPLHAQLLAKSVWEAQPWCHGEMLLWCNGALGPCCNDARGSGCSGPVGFREAHSRGCHSSSTRSFDILGICLLGRRGLPWGENHCYEPWAAACLLREVGTGTSSPFSQQCHWGGHNLATLPALSHVSRQERTPFRQSSCHRRNPPYCLPVLEAECQLPLSTSHGPTGENCFSAATPSW